MSVYQITWWTRLSHSGTVLWLSPGSAPHFSWKKCNMSVFVWAWAGREQLSELYRQSLTILRVFFLFPQKTTGCLKKPLMHRMQFSCMCYIPVTAHHAHDLFIDVLLVVFLWQHSGLFWNIYISFFIPPLSGEVIFLSGFQVFLDAPQSLVCRAELCVYAAEFCLSLSTWQKPPHLDIKEDILKVVLFIHNLAVLVLTV